MLFRSVVRGTPYRSFEDIKRWRDIELVNLSQIENGDIATLDRILPQICKIDIQNDQSNSLIDIRNCMF